MAKYSKTEIEALYEAIETINGLKNEAQEQTLKDLCSLYDKLSGVKYSKSKNTYDFIKKVIL